jgi:hypothetical protein
MEGQVRQAVFAVELRGPEVDPHPTGDLAIDRPAPPYAAGAPGSSSGGRRFTSMFGSTSVLNARGICARIQARRPLMKAMISARPLSPSANLYRGSFASAFIRSPTVPFEKPISFRIVSICACSRFTSLSPNAWTSSGDMFVVVEALSAHR